MSFLRVCSVSGGKDSTATYLLMVDRYGRDGFHAVFADTGNEHPVTYNYVRNMHEFCGGPKVTFVTADFKEKLDKKGIEATGNPFLDMMLWKGRAPSTRAQFCTEHLKLQPIRDWLIKTREATGLDPIMYVGIRAGESEKRSKMPEQELNEYMDCLKVHPILKWSEAEVFAFLASKNVEPNPLYKNGSARVGCYPCIHSRKSELASLENWSWEKLVSWETAVRRTWFSYGTVPLTTDQEIELSQIPLTEQEVEDADPETGEVILVKKMLPDEKLLSAFKNKNSPSVQAVREWSKTTRGGRQMNLFAEDAKDVPSCMNTWGQCE
jgi:3'-phosphoadenosine 5'-phosphosulfate sulfotransferase (PAPS reductase)/FAD synthetase